MFHEVSRKSIHLAKYENIQMVWHNNVLTVRCDSGLHLFDFSYNLKCLDKTIDMVESKIFTSKSSPATELFPKNCVSPGIRNMELAQMVLDPALWPHNKKMMEVAIIVAFEWSPIDFIHNNESVIATVNSGGNIDLYVQSRHIWRNLENLSLKLKQEMRAKIPNLIPPFQYSGKINFELIKKTAYALETSSICWYPILNEDRSCYFVTGQKNGTILCWLLKYETSGVDATLLQYITDNTEEIISMKWITNFFNNSLLITSNVLGQITAYQCEIGNKELKIKSTHSLWAHNDKMVVQYIQYDFSQEHMIIICNKHRHLLLLLIDSNCEVVNHYATNITDQRITSVIKSKKSLYMSTVNRELYEIKYVITNNILDVHLEPIEMKPIPSAYELQGIGFSTNNLILVLPLLDRTILYRKTPMKLEIVFYTTESLDLIGTIINSPTKTLSNFWDVIELLRVKILKSKVLPDLDYNKLYKDAQVDIFYGKVYLLLLKFYDSLEITVQNNSRGLLPETSIDVIKSHIIVLHIKELIKKINESQSNVEKENTVVKLENQSLYMAGVYLKEYCKNNKKKLNELLPPDIVKMLQKVKDPQFICQWCDNKLNGFECKDNHINSFCSLSLIPIESNDYLVCRCCGATASMELYLDKPKCIFCDLYLCHCYLPL